MHIIAVQIFAIYRGFSDKDKFEIGINSYSISSSTLTIIFHINNCLLTLSKVDSNEFVEHNG